MAGLLCSELGRKKGNRRVQARGRSYIPSLTTETARATASQKKVPWRQWLQRTTVATRMAVPGADQVEGVAVVKIMPKKDGDKKEGGAISVDGTTSVK